MLLGFFSLLLIFRSDSLATLQDYFFHPPVPSSKNMSQGNDLKSVDRNVVVQPTDVDMGTTQQNDALRLLTESRLTGRYVRDYGVAQNNLANAVLLRQKSDAGDLEAVASLLEVAELCRGGVSGLSKSFAAADCLGLLGLKKQEEIELLIVDLLGKLAAAGFPGARTEYAAKVASMFQDGKLSRSSEAGSDRAARALGYLLDQSDSGSADAAFRLAQTYTLGLLAPANSALAATFAESARQRDSSRFDKVEAMLR